MRQIQTPRAAARVAAYGSATSPLARTAAILFFIAALGLLAMSARPFVQSMLDAARQSSGQSARGATYLVNLNRAPTVDAGRFRYAILGLGQDADSGRQIVWMRSLTTNRVGGFAAGEKVFGGPVRVADIEGLSVELAYRGQVRGVLLAP